MGRRKGNNGVSDKKRTKFLAKMGLQGGTSTEPAQSDQAKADGEAVLRERILANMSGNGYGSKYKAVATALGEEPGAVKAQMDYLVGQGVLQKGKGGYRLAH